MREQPPSCVVGEADGVGAKDGSEDGAIVVDAVGESVGGAVGLGDGWAVGSEDGMAVGMAVGDGVSHCAPSSPER